MEYANRASIGRHVVDIDGALRATDQASVSAADILELGGFAARNLQVFMDIYGESWPIGPTDRIALNEDTVAFFHTSADMRGRSGAGYLDGSTFARAA